MNILAFDTTMGACSVAVRLAPSADGGHMFSAFQLMERGHAEALLGMVTEVMTDAGIGFTQLERIAVTTGPGTFTGVRIGVASARAMAMASGLGLVGVSSLAVMARHARAENAVQLDGCALAVCTDARRGQIYLQMFAPDGIEASQPMVVAPQAAGDFMPSGRIVAIGSGAQLLEYALSDPHDLTVLNEDLQPDAATLADYAAEIEPGSEPVVPLYLRPPDAKPQAGFALPRLGS